MNLFKTRYKRPTNPKFTEVLLVAMCLPYPVLPNELRSQPSYTKVLWDNAH